MIAEQLHCLSQHDLSGQGRCGEAPRCWSAAADGIVYAVDRSGGGLYILE